MLLTEEEAKKKWCPFARAVVGEVSNTERPGLMRLSYQHGTPAINRVVTSKPNDMETVSVIPCIGSACMMWRAVIWSLAESSLGEGEDSPQEKSFGYCGLAGDPRRN